MIYTTEDWRTALPGVSALWEVALNKNTTPT